MDTTQETAGIAIIGMACRFPGADNPSAFWHNLCQGVESITFFSDDELLAAGVDADLLQEPHYVKAAPILHDVDKFDASFFEYSPKEAAFMDPQQRLFLEVAWEAFEDAGYNPDTDDSVIGVIAGGGGVVTSYLVAHQGHPDLPGQTAGLQHIGNDKDFLSTRVSYKLNLTGPSLTVQTACSTSLVAVHLACQSLLRGECDMVLAGGVTVRIPHISGYRVEKGNVHSLDGHCRAFDAAGQGTIFGSGVGAVLLKHVEDAIADGDHIYAVIKGTAVNNDGAMKVSYTAPSVAGQARAMVEAFTAADISPETVGYVECHATGTSVGDPLEIQALTRAFRMHTSRRRFCAIGSVKTNIGHPEQAAGLAALIKAALTLHWQCIPPSLHFVTPNPKIDFGQSPFYVNTALSDWPASDTPRRAAVNSLGIGGTNAFAVLEEAPERPPVSSEPERSLHLFSLSAKNEAALVARAAQFHAFLDVPLDASLANICYTANVSRSSFPHRFAVTTDSVTDLQAKLAAFVTDSTDAAISSHRARPKPLVFLFSGQGSQYPGMALDLYHTQPTFREVLQQCDAYLRPHLDHALLDVLFAQDDKARLLHETAYTQPALFAVEYALAQLWQAWGLVPEAVMGHSIGELVAACVAGVFGLEDALRLVIERGRLMQSLPKLGTMAAVFAAPDVLQDILAHAHDGVAIAAINSPQNTVVSGKREAVMQLLGTLNSQGITAQTLTVSHAFHSSLMAPILDAFEEVARRIPYRDPNIPLISNLTGRPMEAAPDAPYWCHHIRHTVRFAEGMQTLHELGYELFLEVGPGSALLSMGRQCLPAAQATWLPSLLTRQTAWQTLLESLRQLYLKGFAINWQMVDQGLRRRRVPLPTYPFQRKRYWLETVTARHTPSSRHANPSAHPLLGSRLRSGLKEVQFESSYSLEQIPWLQAHRVYGLVTLPTTAGLEAAIAVGRAHFGVRDLQLDHLMYHEALVLSDDETRLVHFILTPQGVHQASFQLLSTAMDDGEDTWRTHLSGVVKSTAEVPVTPAVSLTAIQARCLHEIPAERYYASLRALGLDYGPAFQGIRQLWQGAGEALSWVHLPQPMTAGPYALHPAFLDACLHLYPALVPAYDDFSSPAMLPSQTYLPTGIEHFRIYQDHITEAWVHAILRHDLPEGQTLVIDIRLYDQACNVVAEFDGLSVRVLPPEALRPAAADTFTDWLYHLRWDECAPSAPSQVTVASGPKSWLVFADRDGVGLALAERLEQRGEPCHVVFPDTALRRASGHWHINPEQPEDMQRLVHEVSTSAPRPCLGVIYLWGLDLPAMSDMTFEQLEHAEVLGTGAALLLIQTLAEARSAGGTTPRLWFITRQAQNPDATAADMSVVQAPLWGLGRTVALEYPSMWGGLIDLPPAASPQQDSAMLLAELRQTAGEDQIALRQGKRFGARLARFPRSSSDPDGVRFRADATYIITGGLGMLGLRIARWLVSQKGVQHLVLTGRRGANGPAQDAVRELEANGAHVHVIQADVSVEADVQRMLQEIQQHLPPLKGIIHCAGILDDSILSRMDGSQFTRVTAPKIKGSWLLHYHTQHLELDVFILQSSILSLTGSAGQANYTAGNAFLDAMISYRRALGLSAMGLNWGPWDEAGMATASGARGKTMWTARGMRYIPPEAGLAIFDYLLQRQVDHAAVTITDWPLYLAQFPKVPPFYTELAQDAGSQWQTRHAGAIEDVQAHLRQAPEQEHRPILVTFIQQQVMNELGFDESIDTRQPLNELGLDSLMSVNVVNRLETALEMTIPVATLIQGPSVEQLVDELFPNLSCHAGAAVSPEMAVSIHTDTDSAVPPNLSRTFVTAGDGWLVFPRPNATAKLRLFCFPFAGGGAATYRTWPDVLHPAIEVVAIEPPGRASRIHEPPITTLETYLDALVAAMTPYLDKPCVLFGHCLGGLNVFETARAIRRRAQPSIAHIFVSGSRPPHRVTRDGPFEERLLSSLLELDTFDPFLPAHEQPDDVFAAIIRHFNIGATDDFLANPELRHLLLPAIRADFAMASRYEFTPEPPWDIPFTCFTGRDDPYVTHADTMAWGQYTQIAFRVYMRPGAHFLVVDDRDFILQTINRELSRSL